MKLTVLMGKGVIRVYNKHTLKFSYKCVAKNQYKAYLNIIETLKNNGYTINNG